jgi:nitroimidazol reductase NimA-like FMN-containing flavoprotein (pyridoxamine 5'-phosphate oxidase superfamily)
MRRAEREITDQAAIAAIFDAAPLLYLSFHDEPAPYVVPVCFGIEGDTLWVHSARAGT